MVICIAAPLLGFPLVLLATEVTSFPVRLAVFGFFLLLIVTAFASMVHYFIWQAQRIASRWDSRNQDEP